MTSYIAETEIPVIESVTLSQAVEVEELDWIDVSDNLIFTGPPQPSEIEINFTLIKSLHTETIPVEEQRLRVKSLKENNISDNSFAYQGLSGYLAIESIDIPENSDEDTLRRGTISGVYFPWPKKHSDQVEPAPDEGPFGRFFGTTFGGT